MEEQEKSKEVKMQPIAGGNQDNTKQPELTLEQLKEMANKLLNDNRWLKQQLDQMQQALMSFDRLDYLLKVISVANACKDYSFDTEFIQKCIDEVQKGMTPPEETKQATENSKEK